MSSNRKTARPAKGESNVWLTGMGLAVGIVMVAGLLLLVFTRGMAVHWPARVTEVTLKEGASSALGDVRTIAGEVVMRRQRSTGSGEEIQLHTGNKDLYGQNYLWLQSSDIATESDPRDILVVERLEYGDAICRPEELTLAGGEKIPATDGSFFKRLAEVVEEAAERREKLVKIEKGRIGDINRQLKKLEIEERRSGTAAVEKERAALQAQYEEVAAEAKVLRDKGSGLSLTYTVSGGQEKVLPVDSIVRFYQPNEIGFWGRLAVWWSHFWEFVSGDPREANTEGGIFPCIFGTFAMTIIMALLVTPLGVIAAIYLREYARQGTFVRAVRISVNNLAGVPSIVFGVFGMGFFIYTVGHKIDSVFYPREIYRDPVFGTGGILWASLTLALLTLPVVIVATEEALAAVPRGVREAALACGASRWQTIQRVVLPSAAPGVLTGVILAMARGAGEVAPLMVTGVTKFASELPIDTTAPFVHADRKFMHLGFHIYDVGFQSPDSEAAKPMVFATTLLLILLVVVMNLAAIMIRNHLRKKYAASTF